MSSQLESPTGVESEDPDFRTLTSADTTQLIGVRVKIKSTASGIRYTGTIFRISIKETSILLTDVKVRASTFYLEITKNTLVYFVYI